jgi:arginase
MPKLPISIIGAPTDIGAGARGASMGPEALRVAGIVPTLQSHDLEVADRGNLVGPANPWLPPVEGYRHLAEVAQWNRTVHDAVHAELQQQRLPILLGGDHCLGIGSISAVARHCRETNKKLRVLWLDAHADFNTSVLTPSGNIHGMPVAVLCGHGPKELTEIGGTVPAIHPKWVRQIGIRSVDAGEKRFVHEQDLEVFDMRYIDEMGMRHTMELALATLDAHTPARQLRRRFPRPRHRPRRRHHRARRADVPRSAVVHGNDRRHRPPRIARRDGAQPGAGRAQQDGRAGGGPDREPVRQEHVDAGSLVSPRGLH